MLAAWCVAGVVVACGRSERSESDHGSGDTGGTATTGGAAMTGGAAGETPCVPGTTQACFGPGRCDGAQSCSPDGSGWTSCDCGAAGSGGVGGRGGDGGAGGAAGDPFAMCPARPLPFGTSCSLEATCRELDCGSATSLHDEDGCLRAQCRSSDDCAAGERCLPAPVAGEIRECWPSGVEGCDESDGACSCSFYLDCTERAVCVSPLSFPEDEDCPTEGLTCAEVRAAIADVETYLGSGDNPFGGDALAALASCREALLAAEPAPCDF